MPDESLDILIRTKADLQGAEQATGALTGLKKETISAAQYTKDSLSPALAHLTEEEKKLGQETAGLTLKKRNLKAVIEGLKGSFPELARVARLALNPITLIVAATAGSVMLFKRRVEEATKAFAGMELPDISGKNIERINAAATAWNAVADGLERAQRAYGSVTESSKRVEDQLKAELDAQKKLLEAQKKLDEARLEASKGDMRAIRVFDGKMSG
jgi:hypothetical protein